MNDDETEDPTVPGDWRGVTLEIIRALVGDETADRIGTEPNEGVAREFALASFHSAMAELDDRIAEAARRLPQLVRFADLSPPSFQRKHGTAERWDVCDCAECEAGRPEAGVAFVEPRT